MERDALAAGISYDGLRSKRDIKILICSILDKATEPLNADDLAVIIYQTELANYFELQNGIAGLIENGNVLRNDDGILSVSDYGHQVAENMYTSLPLTVREKAESATEKLLHRKRSEKQNKVQIEQLEHGSKITCQIMSGSEEILCVSLTLPGTYEAAQAKEHFLDEPEELYKLVYSFLSDTSELL